MSCGCQNKIYSKDYERVKKLAQKMASIDQKAYFIYKNKDKYDFQSVYPISDRVLEALEFVLPV